MTDAPDTTTAADLVAEFYGMGEAIETFFAAVHIDDAVEIPAWPQGARRPDAWETPCSVFNPETGPFRITADRELHERQSTYRSMTADEKQAYAEKHGYDSWDSLQAVYDDTDFRTDDDAPGELPFLRPTGVVEDGSEWVLKDDINTLSFHARMPVEPLDEDEWTDGVPDPDEYIDAPLAAWTATLRDGTVVDIEFEAEKDASDDAESPF